MILIVGTGAMALLFGGRLAAAGEEVIFLGSWEDGIQAINQSGIRVVENGAEATLPARAISDPAPLEDVKQAIVLVKSWQTGRAADQLKGRVAPDGVLLTLQNGIGNAAILRERLGEKRIFQGVTTYGATLLGPGVVRPAGEGMISVEERAGVQALMGTLKKGGLTCRSVANLEELVWGKLAVNVAINPITALLGVKNGELLNSPSAERIMGLAAAEVVAVARAKGIQLEFGDPLKKAAEVAANTAENLSSMLQDILRGAPTEIDFLCGAVVNSGAKHQIPTPVNELLLGLIKARVDLAGGMIHESSQDTL